MIAIDHFRENFLRGKAVRDDSDDGRAFVVAHEFPVLENGHACLLVSLDWPSASDRDRSRFSTSVHVAVRVHGAFVIAAAAAGLNVHAPLADALLALVAISALPFGVDVEFIRLAESLPSVRHGPHGEIGERFAWSESPLTRGHHVRNPLHSFKLWDCRRRLF